MEQIGAQSYLLAGTSDVFNGLLSPTHEGDDFHTVSVPQHARAVLAPGNDILVDLDRDGRGADLELLEEFGDRQISVKLAPFAVYLQADQGPSPIPTIRTA